MLSPGHSVRGQYCGRKVTRSVRHGFKSQLFWHLTTKAYLPAKGQDGSEDLEAHMATGKQVKAARRNVIKAREAVTSKRSIAHMPKQNRTALGKQ
jgi:hypothetical protein